MHASAKRKMTSWCNWPWPSPRVFSRLSPTPPGLRVVPRLGCPPRFSALYQPLLTACRPPAHSSGLPRSSAGACFLPGARQLLGGAAVICRMDKYPLLVLARAFATILQSQWNQHHILQLAKLTASHIKECSSLRFLHSVRLKSELHLLPVGIY